MLKNDFLNLVEIVITDFELSIYMSRVKSQQENLMMSTSKQDHLDHSQVSIVNFEHIR